MGAYFITPTTISTAAQNAILTSAGRAARALAHKPSLTTTISSTSATLRISTSTCTPPRLSNGPEESGIVTLAQTTRFPESDEVRLVVTLPQPMRFGLKFRVPGWLAGPIQATINGREARLVPTKNIWATLNRRWKSGDKITLRLPMSLRASPLDPQHPTPAAVVFGPVVLAFEAPTAQALQRVDMAALNRVLAPEGQPLCFNLVTDPAVHARPFYAFRGGERYFVYLDPKMGERIPHQDVKFTGQWGDAGEESLYPCSSAQSRCCLEVISIERCGISTVPCETPTSLFDGSLRRSGGPTDLFRRLSSPADPSRRLPPPPGPRFPARAVRGPASVLRKEDSRRVSGFSSMKLLADGCLPSRGVPTWQSKGRVKAAAARSRAALLNSSNPCGQRRADIPNRAASRILR